MRLVYLNGEAGEADEATGAEYRFIVGSLIIAHEAPKEHAGKKIKALLDEQLLGLQRSCCAHSTRLQLVQSICFTQVVWR